MTQSDFQTLFGTEPEFDIKAPGRTELGGNHTDHQRGRVLAGPVNLYAKALVSRRTDGEIRIHSEGYEPCTVDLADTSVHPEEYGKTSALVRGIANGFKNAGLEGFNALISSDIPPGSGLSSSAAVEILLGRICCALTGVKKTAEELAKLGQSVENRYFGKPCGLLDQMACAAGGIITIDFMDPEHPKTEPVPFDFQEAGYSLCILNCGAGHENLTENYAEVTGELAAVCSLFHKKVLREIPPEEFYDRIREVRTICGDRAALRAMHVYAENDRVAQQVDALKRGDIERYLMLVNESGRSSWTLLQNVIPDGAVKHQEMAFALANVQRLLNGRGAVRVHGGGFAGTLQAYVPNEFREGFRQSVENILGEGSCFFVQIPEEQDS